jgi:hypothetical protein
MEDITIYPQLIQSKKDKMFRSQLEDFFPHHNLQGALNINKGKSKIFSLSKKFLTYGQGRHPILIMPFFRQTPISKNSPKQTSSLSC